MIPTLLLAVPEEPPPYTIFTWLEQWGTLAVAGAALGIGLYNLWKGRDARVTWSGRVTASSYGGATRELHVVAVLTNEGPAPAERVGWQFKVPGGEWTEVNYGKRRTFPEVVRGGSVPVVVLRLTHELIDGVEKYPKPSGRVKVKIHYRRLRNTARVRTKKLSIEMGGLDI